jgi:cell division protein FtsW
MALQDFGNPHHYLPRQSIYVGLSFIAAMFGFLFPFRILREKAVVMAGILFIFALLIILMFFGREDYGAQRWLVTPYFNLQPTELAKFVVIWYFAYILSRKQKIITNEFVKAIIAPCILVGMIVFFIFIQPDLGSSVIIVLTGAIMIFASGVSPKVGIGFSVFGFLGLTGLFQLVRRFGTQLFFLRPYQYQRFLAFWDPFAITEDGGMVGMQLVNSYYALSQGGVFGVGIGNSIQKTGYLPFPYTDFIMSIVGEELGLLGVLVILFLFSFMISRMFLTGIRTKRTFDSLLCIGIGSLFMVQGFINLGGVIGIMPITGVTFPFISYGGTSLLVSALAVGFVANVSARENLRRSQEKMNK